MKHMLIIAAPALALLFIGCGMEKDAKTASNAAQQAQASAAQAQQSAQQASQAAQTASHSAQTAQHARVQTVASQLGATERQGEGGANEWVISSGLLFNTNSAELSQDAKSKLDQVAKTLKSAPSRATNEIHIQGYTDDRGSDQLNADLSQKRAQAVADYLESHGVPQAQVTTQGMGSANPVASEQTAAGRAKNRRAEIIIRPSQASQAPTQRMPQ
jgi:outer membrane protein OmpA-like peptidoglycan-associated protein